MAVAQGIAKTIAIKKQSGLGSPIAGASAQLLRRRTASFNKTNDTYTSEEIASHQQSTGATQGIGKTTGSLSTELSAGTYPLLFAGLLRRDFAAVTPITGLGIAVAVSGSLWTLTRAGSWFTDGIKVGHVLRLSAGAMNPANLNKNLLVVKLTATVATVIPVNGAPLVAEASVPGNTVTVVGKATHVPTASHTNDYFGVEQAYVDLTKYELYNDVKVASANLTVPATGIATADFDLPGLSRTLGTSSVLTSPSAETTSSVLTAVLGRVVLFDVGGTPTVTTVTSLNINVNGNIQPGEAEVGSNSISDHQRGRVTVDGSFTAKFSSTALQAIRDAQTLCNLMVVIADSASPLADFIAISLPAVKIMSDDADDGEKEIIRTYNFTAQIDSTGDATGSSAAATHKTIIQIQDSLA